MSAPSDDEKAKQLASIQRFIELQRTFPRSRVEREEYQALMETAGKMLIENPKILNELEAITNQKISYHRVKGETIEALQQLHSSKIIDDYKVYTGTEPKLIGKEAVLDFKEGEAMEFFASQAKKGRAFHERASNSDYAFYSDGTGTFIHGKNKEIEDYIKNPQNFQVNSNGFIEKNDDGGRPKLE